MKWTNNSPTQEGYYFVREINGVVSIHYVGRVVCCESMESKLVVFIGPDMLDVRALTMLGTKWAGPIPMPEPEETA